MAARLYYLLLLALPGWFREEFAGEMTAVFRATWRDARRDGLPATLACGWHTVADVLALAVRLHLDAARQDVTYAARTLRRSPAFTTAAIATLAVGMGPTLVVANLLHQVVLQPLPFDEADRLVSVWNADPSKNRHEFPLSTPDFIDFRDQQTVFDALAAHTGTSVAWVGAGEPRQIAGVVTTADLFGVLRVQPVLGRPLVAADSAPGAPRVIVLGSELWRSEFGARPDVIGTSVRIDGEPAEIVGVLPENLTFPRGSAWFWVPLTLDPAAGNRGSHFLNATGRLAAGVTVAQAEATMNGVARALTELYPQTNGGNGIELIPLKTQLNGDASTIIQVLAIAIAAVLLIACANVASLLTVRASLRGQELAVRTAIGATARRLRRQLVAENLLMAGAAGVLAVAIAVPLHRTLIAYRLLALPDRAATFGWTAFAALALFVVAIGVAFAALTARRSAHGDRMPLLTASARHGSSVAIARMRQGLVVAEVAAALVLVVVAGLMLQSAARLTRVDPGFRTDSVITFGVVLPSPQYSTPDARRQFVARAIDNLAAIPGVRQVAAGAYAPMGQMRATRRFAPADRPLPPPGAEPLALDLPVGANYFDVLGIPVVDGRVIDARDTADSPPVLVVSETFARQVFPGERAVGKRIGFFTSRPGGTPPPAREIVGVVRDMRHDDVSRMPYPQMYAPYEQTAWGFTSFFVRTDLDPALVRASLQQAITRIDPQRPIRDVLTTAEIVSGSTARERAMAGMLIALAVIALLLATIGLYGVSATASASRAREFAIRTAVGAQQGQLLRTIVGHGLVTALIGVAIGAASSAAVTRGLGSLLYETPARDPVTFVATAVLLLSVAGVATYLPARRTLDRNPADVLRAE
jgi:putative ABC transport system permease protein